MTTATTWRKERGRETERLAAAYLTKRGWAYAQPVGASRPGADITGTPGLAAEVKATKSCSPLAWLRQAHTRRQGGDVIPFVIWRPDGQGGGGIGTWPVLIEFDYFIGLLHAAGYGDSDVPVLPDVH